MSRLNQAIDRLGSKTIPVFEEEKQKRIAAKKRVRAESPEMADFLNEIIAEFGKVKMAVWLGDERVL